MVLEDAARGKGRAVRTGLTHATGDFVLIQDADLEYDLNDYNALLEPLSGIARRSCSGAGTGRASKDARVHDNPLQATAMNLGHVFFTMLINVLYRQRMSDPFTMFKVFRRDCLSGLTFECNGFDFDHELVIKLVRKGYTPLEIPVNYRSRSQRGQEGALLPRPPPLDLDRPEVSIHARGAHGLIVRALVTGGAGFIGSRCSGPSAGRRPQRDRLRQLFERTPRVPFRRRREPG